MTVNLLKPDNNQPEPGGELRLGRFFYEPGYRPLVMGILNITDDSFSGDGLWPRVQKDLSLLIQLAEKMCQDGADIIDIGCESSRPGAEPLDLSLELERIQLVLQTLSGHVRIPLSVDTYKPEVARVAVELGASLINTIKGCPVEPTMIEILAAHSHVGLCLMHMKGQPKDMQTDVHYESVMGEVFDSLQESFQRCVQAGIAPERLVIDPGIGFGKHLKHNLILLNRLRELNKITPNILVGVSNKSMIGQIVDQDVGRRNYGSISAQCAAILHGAKLIRVHHVKAAVESVRVLTAITQENYDL